VETTKIPRFEMSDDQKTRISYGINSFKSETNMVGKRFRNPLEFLQREAKDRYEIPKKLTVAPKTAPNAVEEVHRDIIVRHYNL
jgi:hypothetical protein